MYNIKKLPSGLLMFGQSTESYTECVRWLQYYRLRYPQFKFKIVHDAPKYTCDIPFIDRNLGKKD